MILDDKVLNVKSSGIESKKFSINFNQKIFNLLSSKIYANPIKALIREIGCNAYDSHVAANKKDIPFEVHLPNTLENYFSVKDFGLGLSQDDVLNLYSQYGASTKSNSNDFVGAMGIGSKSPFAYSDSFMVESIFNGIKSVYTAFLDSDGIPSISEPLSQDKTSECNGVTITIPVKSSDMTRFVNEASDVFRWFKVRPIIKGSSYFSFPADIKYLHEFDFYALPQFTVSPMIIMGNVSYPISTNNIIPNHNVYYSYYNRNSLSSNDQKIAAVLQQGIVLFANIGDVEVTASREQLSYGLESGETKKTVDYIKKQCLAAYAHLEVELTKSVNSAKDIWDARKNLYKIKISWHQFPTLQAKWNNKDITASVPLEYNKTSILLTKIAPSHYRKSKTASYVIRNSFIPFEEDIYILDCHGAVSRITEEVIKTNKTIYYFNDTPPDAWVKENSIPIKKASDLPPVPKKVSVRATAQKAKVYKFKQDGKGNLINWWEATEIDLDSKETFIYVNIAFFKFKNKDGVLEYPQNLANLCKVIYTLDKGVTVYGIRESDITYLKKSKGTWIKVFDYIEQKNKELEKLYKDKALNRLQYINFVEKNKLETLQKISPQNKDIKQVIDEFDKCKKDSSDPKVISYLNLNNQMSLTKNNLEVSLKEILDKYKVLKCIDWYRDPKDLKVGLEEYFNLVK